MIQPSKVLLIFIGSKEKKPGGTRGYPNELTLLEEDDYRRPALLAGRARVFDLIKKGGKTRDGKRIADLPGNGQLARGPDFGGASREGRYLPAGERFQGSFFTQLGSDGSKLLAEASSSVLILSGLYGAVTPAEPIQDHTCHFNDHPRIRETWTDRHPLSEVVINYIQKHDIKQVFDFTALHSCRYLLDWTSIRNQVSGKVLHLFGEQTRGEGLLTPLGALAKDFLATRSLTDLLCLQAGQFIETPTERIYLHSRAHAACELPLPLTEEVNLFDSCDDVVSMARDIRRILSEMKPLDDKQIRTRIDTMGSDKRIPKHVISAMKNILHWSNEIEDSYTFTALQLPIDWLKGQYETVLKWAEA